MSEPTPTRDTAVALRKLADRVTVAADVDPILREELVGHLEDKLLDYTSGRLRPSEADALLLVERHLGDPGTLSDRLARAYGRWVSTSLVDRLLTLVTATAAVFAVVDTSAVAAVPVLSRFAHLDARTADVMVDAACQVHPIVTAGLLWGWLARARGGGTVPRSRRLVWAAVACIACLAVPFVRQPSYVPAIGRPSWLAQLEQTAVRPYGLFGLLAVGAAWLWWGTRGRPWRSAAPAVMLAWVVATTAMAALRPHWIIVSRFGPGPWYEPVRRLRGPTLDQVYVYGPGAACFLLPLVSLLLMARLIWDRLARRIAPRPLTAA